MGKSTFFILLTLSFLALFQNCSGPQQPGVDPSSRPVYFSHTNLQSNCMSCHEGKRPLTITKFDHVSTTYGGNADCAGCHLSNAGKTWTGGTFAHNPQPSTCIGCHLSQRPLVLAGASNFNHDLNGKGDCVGCHNSASIYTSKLGWVGTGQALPGALVGTRQLSLTVGKPNFTNSTISSVTSSVQNLPIQMLHSSFDVPSTLSANCSSCHAQAASGNYSGGVFHASLTTNSLAQPTSCKDCHTSLSPIGFVGPAGSNRTPASASMRHEATAWSQSTGTWHASTTPLVTADCVKCHTNTGSFANAQYHSNLTGTQPNSCLACHANSRPVLSVGTPPFNHQNNGGLGDCMQCHASTSVWTGGQFAHAGTTSCSSCHASERPTSTTGWVTAGWSSATTTFNLQTHGGVNNDCYSCHSTTTTFNTIADWVGGHKNHAPKPANCVSCHIAPTGLVGSPAFDHASTGGQDCLGCHTTNSNYTNLTGWAGASATPAGLVNADMTKFSWAYVSANITKLTYTGNLGSSTTTITNAVKLPLQMLHSSPSIGTNVNTCTDCHTVGTSAASGTQFHSSLTRLGKAQPTNNCASCHAPGAVPVGIVGPKTGASDMTVNMDHAATGVTECSTCHAGNSVGSFKNANFHANVNAASVTACTACHFVKAPTTLNTSTTSYTSSNGQIFPQHFMHKSNLVTQDCTSCHLQKGPGPVNPWTTTVLAHSIMSAASLTTCNDCHGNAAAVDRPNTTTWYPSATANRRYLHTSTYGGLNDCQKCHTKQATSPFTNLTQVGVSWNNGLYNHLEVKTKDKTATCANCHTPVSGGFYNHSSAGPENTQKNPCMTCHSAAPAF